MKVCKILLFFFLIVGITIQKLQHASQIKKSKKTFGRRLKTKQSKKLQGKKLTSKKKNKKHSMKNNKKLSKVKKQ